jgi:peptidoglycan/xylan/chitin deacetylase (PgdA/CDA1 family)
MAVVLIVGVAVAINFKTQAAIPTGKASCNCVAFRLDDIQAFWIRQSQQAIVKTFNATDTPLTVGIIGYAFGNDRNNTEFFRNANVEMANHGWRHENFGNLTMAEQLDLMNQTNQEVERLYGKHPEVFIAPYNALNSQTIDAAKQMGFEAISGFADTEKFGNSRGIMEVPGTVNAGDLSDKSPTQWTTFNSDSVLKSIKTSIKDHGYAVVVMHPQVYFDGKGVNKAQLDQLVDLIKKLKESDITITTISKVS